MANDQIEQELLKRAAGIVHANRVALDLVSGTNTGDQTNITGNAGTATALQTARTINGVLFDGTEDIVLPASGIDEAPIDGKLYVRSNGTWQELVIS